MFFLDNIPPQLHDTTNLYIQHFTDSLQRSALEFPANGDFVIFDWSNAEFLSGYARRL
jgi:hypothetical protein